MDRFIVCIPEYNAYIDITEGDGSNLWQEDIESGAVDYFICELKSVGIDRYGELQLNEEDSAQVLLDKSYAEFSRKEIAEKALDMLSYQEETYYKIVETTDLYY